MYKKVDNILNRINLSIELYNIGAFSVKLDNRVIKDFNKSNKKLLETIKSFYCIDTKERKSPKLTHKSSSVDLSALSNLRIINSKTLDETELVIYDIQQTYFKYIDTAIYDLDNLPDGLNISVMSTTGKINSKFFLDNINDYLSLSENDVVYIKYKGKQRFLESCKKKIKKEIKSFENQLTMVVKLDSDRPLRQINIKIFKNGSFQMTGCKSIEDCNIVINKLLDKFRYTYAVIEDEKIVDKPFMENIIDPKVISFKIDMINSNFFIDYKINGEKLYKLLQREKMTCRYEPCMHPGVNIKFKLMEDNEQKKVSIFVFQSGNIIITGAKNKNQIIETYNYIKNLLEVNKPEIIKKNLINILDKNDIDEIISTI